MASHKSLKEDVAKIQIYADARRVDDFTEFYKRLGMTQREAGSRLFTWFNEQSPLIRQHIMQPMPEEVAPDIARIILERMAEQDRFTQPNTEPESQSSHAATRKFPPHQIQHLTVHGPDTPTNQQAP